MIWWLKLRAVPALAAGTTATFLIGLLIGSSELPVPALAGQAGHFLVGHLITLVPGVLLLYGAARADRRTERIATRPLTSWDTCLALGTAAVAMTAAVLCHLLWRTDITMVLGRNIAGYIGLALLLAPLLGHRVAAAALATVPLICAAAGWGLGGRPQPWAWLLYPGNSLPALALAGATLCAGTAATALIGKGAAPLIARIQ
ncbi:hypothetical protein GLX30_00090 [Streptomyces sp. Tu 2975]|uniref:hypothetical protein n=1 Tax=Streptomyces sp. Tu 2975 TaxID=2676871 RepID=UPI001357653E|nr:hypothetical protein [Streptomyces sp. Tu 2975]QIP82743.1 hypothetical protein GLX30_00090 [Streptomyces sp. Tu 2975]